MKVKIANKWVGNNEPVFIVAEAGINHNGEVEKAKMLISAAAEAGADAIKFQTHIPEKEMIKEGPTAAYVGESLFDLLKKVELSLEDYKELKRYAEKKGLLFLSTPFSMEAIDLLDDLGVKAFKISSGDLTTFPMLEKIAKKGKPIILSTGMSSYEEIKNSINFIKKINNQLIILHCTSDYPTKYENVNLGVIKKLKDDFRFPVGISDHSEGIYIALAAVALGACLVEKHFTTNRSWPGPDQKVSIEPGELEELVKGAKAIKKALGDEKTVTKDELEGQKMARKSIVSTKQIPKGTIIKEDMVGIKRPGTGIPAKELFKVIGKRTKRHIKSDTVINWRDLE